jgi:hypothetical protein
MKMTTARIVLKIQALNSAQLLCLLMGEQATKFHVENQLK